MRGLAVRPVPIAKADRRRCYCSSESLSLQPTEEGQFSGFVFLFFFFFYEYDVAGELPGQTPSFSIGSLTRRKKEKKNL